MTHSFAPGSRSHRPSPRQRGFTTIELIVVLVLVGILAAIGLGRFLDRGGIETHAYGEQVRAMLRFAQKSAVARNTSVYVRFEENRISLCHARPDGACPPASQVVQPGGFRAGDDATRQHCGGGNWYCIGRPSGISLYTAPSQPWLEFDALGRPWLPGATPGALTLNVSGGADSVTLSVTEETGYVQ